MAFCTHCGAKLPDGAKFCTTCGKPLTGAPAAKPAEKETRTAAPDTQGEVELSAWGEFVPDGKAPRPAAPRPAASGPAAPRPQPAPGPAPAPVRASGPVTVEKPKRKVRWWLIILVGLMLAAMTFNW